MQQGEWGRIGMLEPQCAVPVEPDALDPRSYTLSLLGVCRENGLLDDTQCGRIRLGLDRIFAETAAEYTKRASSTIPRITARQLYDAVLFRCDAYLSRLPLLEGIHLLQQGNMEEICHRGMECILDAFTRCKEIFRQAYAIRCRLPIGAYQYAMEHAFDRFCKGYSARFDPRNDCMGIDYPLLGRQAYALLEEGVWFVDTYYSCLLLENQLCRMVPASALATLFAGYARSYHCEPEDLHISAAELLVNQLLTGMLLLCRCCLRSEVSCLACQSRMSHPCRQLFTAGTNRSCLRRCLLMWRRTSPGLSWDGAYGTGIRGLLTGWCYPKSKFA